MKKANDRVLAGRVPFRPRERCYPGGEVCSENNPDAFDDNLVPLPHTDRANFDTKIRV